MKATLVVLLTLSVILSLAFAQHAPLSFDQMASLDDDVDPQFFEFAKKGWRATKNGLGRGWRATKSGVGRGWRATKSGVGRGWRATKNGVKKGWDKAKVDAWLGYVPIAGDAYTSGKAFYKMFKNKGYKDWSNWADLGMGLAGFIPGGGAATKGFRAGLKAGAKYGLRRGSRGMVRGGARFFGKGAKKSLGRWGRFTRATKKSFKTAKQAFERARGRAMRKFARAVNRVRRSRLGGWVGRQKQRFARYGRKFSGRASNWANRLRRRMANSRAMKNFVRRYRQAAIRARRTRIGRWVGRQQRRINSRMSNWGKRLGRQVARNKYMNKGYNFFSKFSRPWDMYQKATATRDIANAFRNSAQ